MPFTIKDLEKLTGIKAHTLRIWEQRYSFIKPERSTTNIRYYSDEDLKILLNVSLLNKFGIKISLIDKMTAEEMNERILSLSNAVNERLASDLIKAMIACDIRVFDTLIQEHIDSFGIKESIIKLIYPFLDRIGVLWQSDHINPAQEHLVSNIIRQKLITAIDKNGWPENGGKKACMFLPEGEYHELTLLFITYLFMAKNIQCFYIGASTPLKDVLEITNVVKPDFLYTHITTGGRNFSFDKFVTTIVQMFPSVPIYISGSQSNRYQKKLPSIISLKKNINEVLELIDNILVTP